MLLAQEKIVIAHRGASGYLPEHTLPAKVLAHAQGADYIEQDVVMTRDDALVVLHDLVLDRITDVAGRYPGRAREDGSWYVVDFTLEELRGLRVTEGFVDTDAGPQATFPARFPVGRSRFGIHTLAEEIELIQGLNTTTGRQAGIYVELKSPWFHRREGKDLGAAVLRELAAYGYTGRDDPVYLQTFDYHELRRVSDELMPAMGMELRLVQLIADNAWGETYEADGSGALVPYDYTWMHEAAGLRELARHAAGVGPYMALIVSESSSRGAPLITDLVKNAHAAGLQVHPYTFRLDQGRLPAYAASFEELLDIFLCQAGVDGVFTDFPDRARGFLGGNPCRP